MTLLSPSSLMPPHGPSLHPTNNSPMFPHFPKVPPVIIPNCHKSPLTPLSSSTDSWLHCSPTHTQPSAALSPLCLFPCSCAVTPTLPTSLPPSSHTIWMAKHTFLDPWLGYTSPTSTPSSTTPSVESVVFALPITHMGINLQVLVSLLFYLSL